jgi:hypothetical protein
MEIDKSGTLVRGFFGSYLVENTKDTVSTSTTTSTTTLPLNTVEIMHVLYNSDKGFLYLIFNRDLADSDIPLILNQIIKIGTNVVYLDSFTPVKAMTNFDNVLKITLDGADKTVLDHMVYTKAPSISILNPYEQQRLTSSVDVKFLLYNFELGGVNAIRVTLDNAVVQDITTASVSFTGLLAGVHTIKAQLVVDGVLNTNIESIAEGTFVVYTGTYTSPYLSIVTPKNNQIYSASPVQIEFTVENFPILATGNHLRYSVDGGAPIDHYSDDPILIEDMSNGKHSVRLYLVDKKGVDLGYTYGSATVDLIIGLNSNAIVTYYCSMNGVQKNANVYVGNMIFSDVYSPFDVQYILPGEDISNPDEKESILIGKLTNVYIASKGVV